MTDTLRKLEEHPVEIAMTGAGFYVSRCPLCGWKSKNYTLRENAVIVLEAGCLNANRPREFWLSNTEPRESEPKE